MSLLLRFNHLTTKKAIVNTSPAYPRGIHDGNVGGLPAVEPDLTAPNIRYGKTVFGILGTMVAWIYDLLAEQAVGRLTVPVPTLIMTQTNLNAGDGGQTAEPTLDITMPTIAVTPTNATVAAFDAGVSHKQTGPVDADQTAETNNATANDMNLLPAAGNASGDGFYFGMNAPFDGLTLNVGTPGAGTYTIAWKYWNGAWISLPLTVVNSINHFKTAGLVNLGLSRPADWETIDIATLGAKYYIKAEVTMGTMTTQPKGTQAWANTY